MAGPVRDDAAVTGPEAAAREVFGTRLGFILAAVGSAVGLGNMWRFPYQVAEGGGAAFVLLYIVMTLLVGLPLMFAEFTVGRGSKLSPIGALGSTGGSAWRPMGYLFVLSGLLILSYYSVIAGWTVRYAVEGILGGFAPNPGEHFQSVATGFPAIVYHVAFMTVTVSIVMVGVEKGIERAALVLMPVLFLILIGLAVWGSTLGGAGEGYAFYLAPSLDAVMDPRVFQAAAAQAFFSLSLGMGAMLTFSSYLSRDDSLPQEGTIIAASDFGVAFLAGLVVFPVIFALGLSGEVGESTVGALFISLPGAFVSMGGIGRVVGIFFFLALSVGALTSAISLLEVVTASLIDEFGARRKAAALTSGLIITMLGLAPAVSLDLLGVVDKVAGEFFLVLGGLGMCLLVGWRMKDPVSELSRGASPGFAVFGRGVLSLVKWVAPLIIVFVLYFTFIDTVQLIRDTFGG